ncbi:MAG: hypothetical protein ACJAYU_001925 [Bradymonadia bacterium]|jgi:uncharacterized protein YndB with AHSA1/START domain
MSGFRSSAPMNAKGDGGLTFTWNWDHEPDASERTVELIFEPHGDGTRLALRHGDYGESDAEQEVRRNHRDGWEHFLPALAKLEFDY